MPLHSQHCSDYYFAESFQRAKMEENVLLPLDSPLCIATRAPSNWLFARTLSSSRDMCCWLPIRDQSHLKLISLVRVCDVDVWVRPLRHSRWMEMCRNECNCHAMSANWHCFILHSPVFEWINFLHQNIADAFLSAEHLRPDLIPIPRSRDRNHTAEHWFWFYLDFFNSRFDRQANIFSCVSC